jgi:hypothetical protein
MRGMYHDTFCIICKHHVGRVDTPRYLQLLTYLGERSESLPYTHALEPQNILPKISTPNFFPPDTHTAPVLDFRYEYDTTLVIYVFRA